MTTYSIQNAPPQSVYTAIIIATSWANPFDELTTLEHELKQQGISGTILFDLLCAVGPSSNRFLAVQFTGTHFILPPFAPSRYPIPSFTNNCLIFITRIPTH
ncbi:type II toxin-antitoxin system RnlB family antitoxin [Sulfobacillus thermosulfidooxidans]|uniref:type II toxin-antitoxin system RnlB family antitoxin n=1 Tax=Sulfobacillus thermosulfidooxidans TaxID=28034 RepID=UPI00036D7EDB|nr:type II toxin-antitoxin system RnlB family antitoxin [Sulfobacillus thermosulfidooxidans]